MKRVIALALTICLAACSKNPKGVASTTTPEVIAAYAVTMAPELVNPSPSPPSPNIVTTTPSIVEVTPEGGYYVGVGVAVMTERTNVRDCLDIAMGPYTNPVYACPLLKSGEYETAVIDPGVVVSVFRAHTVGNDTFGYVTERGDLMVALCWRGKARAYVYPGVSIHAYFSSQVSANVTPIGACNEVLYNGR